MTPLLRAIATNNQLLRAIARNPTAVQVLRVQLLKERAKRHFPESTYLQGQWVQARLRLRRYGCRRPRVEIGRAFRQQAA